MTFPATRSLRWGAALCIMAAAPFSFSSPIAGQARKSHKFDSVLTQADQLGTDTVPVIISVSPSARNEVKKALKNLGYAVKRDHSVISAFTVNLRLEDLPQVTALAGVLSASYDAPVVGEAATTTSVSYTSGIVLRETLGLPSTSLKGTGVGVAVIDSGIAPHVDFGSRIKAFYDFTRGGVATKPYDDNGHGTHVAGLIGGSGASSSGTYRGVAS